MQKQIMDPVAENALLVGILVFADNDLLCARAKKALCTGVLSNKVQEASKARA